MKELIRKILSYIANKIYKKDCATIKFFLKNTDQEIKKININLETRKLIEEFLIIAEDKRHLDHIGFDVIAIIRSIRNRLIYHKREGASTIDQQLVRVLTNDYRMSIYRKIKEILLSTTLSDYISKGDIGIIYLINAYYGTKMQGITEVTKKLKIDIKNKIDLNDASKIIARIKYPQPEKFSKEKYDKIRIREAFLLNLYDTRKTKKY